MRSLAPVDLPVLLLVVCLAGHVSSTLLQNYDRARLLASCLGDDAMTRWRQQLESASRACGLQVAPSDQLAPFSPYVPYSVPFQVLHPQRQPVQYLTPVPATGLLQQPVPGTNHLQQQYVIKHQQLVPVGATQQQLAASFPFYQQSSQQLYPQQQMYHQQYPQQQQQLYQQQNSFPNYFPAASQISQAYQPASSQQFSYSVNYLPNEQLLLQQHQQHVLQQQQQQQQQILQQQQQQQQQHLLGQQQTGNSQQEQKLWATQQDTYTNPGLKYEDTEQYQLLQKKLKEAQQQRQALHQTGHTSFHQQMPFFPAAAPTNARQYGPLLPGTVGKDVDTKKSSQPKKRNAEPEAKLEAEASNNFFQVANFKLPLSNLQQQVVKARTEAIRQQQLGHLQERLGDTVDSLTCVMREMKLLTADMQPDYQFLETSLLELPIANPLYEDLLEGQNYCRQTFNCQPQRARLYELPVSSKLSSSLEFFRCFGKEKLRACMKNDLGVLDGLLGGAAGLEPVSPGVLRSQNYGTVLQEVDQLLNGGSGEIVDLLLL